MELFGFEFQNPFVGKPKKEYRSVTQEVNDGSTVVTIGDNVPDDGTFLGGDFSGQTATFDIDPTVTSETQLITKYREISLIAEVEKAIDIIVNEMISTDDNEPISIDLDEVNISENIKKKIAIEFDYVLGLLDFKKSGWKLIKRWYVDGRQHFQVIIDNTEFKNEGIGKVVYIDPRKIKKVRVVKSQKDQRTNADTYVERNEFYIYSENGFANENSYNNVLATLPNNNEGVQLSKESVIQVVSGNYNPNHTVILSWLHKAIRPLNLLRGLEDAAVIYRVVRAPERRIFYIDVGDLTPAKAEQQLKRQAEQYRNKPVYDSASGTIKTASKQMSMLEDYFLPRTGDGKATEVITLPGGNAQNILDEITYNLNKLYNALNVPITRMDPNTGFSIGRSTEITRDEVFFIKFIDRLRGEYSNLFIELLRRQLSLKSIMTPEEFDMIKKDITFEWASENPYAEVLENEVMETRLNLLDRMQPYKGQYFSGEYIKRKVLRQTQEEIDEIQEEMDAEPPPMGMEDDTGIPSVVRFDGAVPKPSPNKMPESAVNAAGSEETSGNPAKPKKTINTGKEV